MISFMALFLVPIMCFSMNTIVEVGSSDLVLVRAVDNIGNISKDNFDYNNLGEIYVNENLVKSKSLNDFTDNVVENNQVEDVSINVDGVVFGKYYYKINSVEIGEGILLGTESTSEYYLNEMVNKVKESIESGELIAEYNRLSRSVSGVQIGQGWELVFSRKLSWSMDHDGIHYGDFSEWYSTYEIIGEKYNYFMMVHETYISPNSDDTDDFRTSKLTYDFSPNNENIELRDYQPKSRNPEITVSYGTNLSAEINNENGLSVNAGVTSSYSAILESPKIFDKGNMADDHVVIEFEYVDPWLENDPFYSYNVNQSMQTAIYILRKRHDYYTTVKLSDKRIVQMIRDDFWFWNDKTVNFNLINTFWMS